MREVEIARDEGAYADRRVTVVVRLTAEAEVVVERWWWEDVVGDVVVLVLMCVSAR